MEISEVTTLGDFRRYVLFLAKGVATTTTRPLEEYLRALWGILQHAQKDSIPFSQLAEALQRAFVADPLPFDEDWLQYTAPPNFITMPPSTALADENNTSFSVFQQMICYQIADLHRMAQAGMLENKFRYLGVRSPTGHSWYNFDPSSYLHCAVQGLVNHDIDETRSWGVFAGLLWLGQIYE